MSDKVRHANTLAGRWAFDLNHGKILGITNAPMCGEAPVAGKYGDNYVEVVDWKKLDLNSFPLIEDFYAEIQSSVRSFGNDVVNEFNSEETCLFFKSPTYTNELSFLTRIEFYYSNIDSVINEDIPQNNYFLGTLETPYGNSDQGWNTQIFKEKGFVYILGGIEICEPYFPIWFKVTEERYKKVMEGLKREWDAQQKQRVRRQQLTLASKVRHTASDFSAAVWTWWHYAEFKNDDLLGEMATAIKHRVDIALLILAGFLILGLSLLIVIFA